jgi:CDP-glucose 4,6-dehydratase
MADARSAATRGFWLDRPVLVTGATGFLGSHLTERLVEAGAAVVAVVRDDVPPTPAFDAAAARIAVVRGDVRDQPLLERVLGEYEVVSVVHLAAQTQVEVANANPVSTFDSNIRGTWSLLEAVRRSPRVRQVVVASSDKAYGAQPRLPYREDMSLLAVHPYDVSKACADMIAMSYHQAFGVPVSVTRCGNLFGGGDMNWSRLVPGTIRSVLRGERPVIRSDGTPTRDYLYVVDGALAYLDLIQAMADNDRTVGQAFNFAPHQPISAIDLARLITKIMDRADLEPDLRGTASNEIPDQALDASKASEMLGWEPRWTLTDGLALTVEWYAEQLGREGAP